MRLLTDSEIFIIVDAYLREGKRSFNYIQYTANGLPGKDTQDKVTDLRLPSRHIQSAPLSKVPQNGTLISVKDICDAVSSPPTAKSKKRVATQQYRQFHAKVDSIVNLALDSEAEANPEYKPHTNRLPITRQVIKATCEAFATLMESNHPATSSRVTNLSHTSDYPSSGSDDFREFTRKITRIAQVDYLYANMVEARLNYKDKQTQLDFHGFQQQLNSQGSIVPPYELSY